MTNIDILHPNIWSGLAVDLNGVIMMTMEAPTHVSKFLQFIIVAIF